MLIMAAGFLLQTKSAENILRLVFQCSICGQTITKKNLIPTRRFASFAYDDKSHADSESFEEKASNQATPEYGYSEELYPGHIRTTPFQKLLLTGGSAVVSLAAPWRDDMIAVMGEVTGPIALNYMRKKMMADPIGRQILEEQPRINSQTVDLDYLKTLPDDTFGKHYSNFLEVHGISPDARRPVRFIDDLELAYVMTRYREVHDLVHTLLGMPTHMLGEVAVKWVEGLQFGLPLGLTGGLFGALRLGPKHMQRYKNDHFSWAVHVGLNAKFLLNVYWEHHWEDNVDELRGNLNIKPPPPTPPRKK